MIGIGAGCKEGLDEGRGAHPGSQAANPLSFVEKQAVVEQRLLRPPPAPPLETGTGRSKKFDSGIRDREDPLVQDFSKIEWRIVGDYFFDTQLVWRSHLLK